MKISKPILQAMLAGLTVGAVIYFHPVEKEIPTVPSSPPEEPIMKDPHIEKARPTRDSLANIPDGCPACGKG